MRYIYVIILLCGSVFAQFDFGQNKIQPIDYMWRLVETSHFEIYYIEGAGDVASVAGAIAESVYTAYVAHFNFTPMEKIPVIIYPAPVLFSETHIISYIIPEEVGGFTEYIKGRMVLPYQGSLYEFKHIIAHELVHVFQLRYVEFLHDEHELFFISFPPLWFTEGQAEVCSQQENISERAEIIYALAQDYFCSPERFYEIHGSYLMYKEAQSFLRFLREIRGQRVDVALLEQVCQTGSFYEIFKSITGFDIETAGKLWRQALLKKYGKILGELVPWESQGKKIIDNGLIVSPVRFGENIICKANFSGYGGIYLIRRGKTKLLKRIELSEKNESVRLFENRISISDSLLVFSSKSGGKEKLCFYDISRSKVLKIVDFPEIFEITSPFLSKGGDSLVFCGVGSDGFTNLYLYDIRNDTLINLTNEKCFYYSDPVVASNGIYFVCDKNSDERWGIYFMDWEGNTTQIMRSAPFFRPRSLAFDKSSNSLAFIADNDTISFVYVYRDGFLYRLPALTASPLDVSFWGKDTFLVTLRVKNGTAVILWSPDSFETIGNFKRRVSPEPTWSIPSLGELSLLKSETPGIHKLSFDFAQGEIGTGPYYLSGGLEFMLSDMVGDRRIYTFLANNATDLSDILEEMNVFIAYDRWLKRTGYTVGVYRFSFHTWDRYEGIYDEVQVGGFGSIRYPFSRFTRIESSCWAYWSDRISWGNVRKDFMLATNLSLIRDNSLWCETGPIDGMRGNITIGSIAGIRNRKLYGYLISADLRKYFRLSRKSCFAQRLTARYSGGPEPYRFMMGGTWDFRGFPYGYFYGKNLAFSSSEIRFPLIEQFLVRNPLVDIDVRGIRGAVFFDCGDAWEEKPSWRGSWGFGMRMSLGYYVVLRTDFSQTTDFHTIDPHWQWDVFFGLDF